MDRWLVCKAVCLGVAVILLTAGAACAQDSSLNPDTPAESAVSADPGASSGPIKLPARLYTNYGWNFLAAYDILDSGLPEGSENGTCTLCLGRTLISGWHLAGTRMFTENFGISIDYSGHNTAGCRPCQNQVHGVDIDEDDQFFMGGITLAKPMGKYVRVFGQAFAGAILAGSRDLGFGGIRIAAIGHHFGPSIDLGGGAEYMFTRRWGMRFFELDYLGSDFNMTTTGAEGKWGMLNDFRLSAGVVLHVGGGQ